MRRTRRLATLLAASALVLVGGCSGGSDADPTPEPTSESPAASESPSGDGDETTSAASGPGAATGRLLQVESAELHAPRGWGNGSINDPTFRTALSGDGLSTLTLAWLGTMDQSLKQLSGPAAELDYDRGPQVSLEEELDGEPAYLVSGKRGLDFVEEYGGLHDGQAVRLTFTFTETVPARERTRTVESVLASFRWR